MDQLFLMQRYWGSDEEDNKEENSFKVNHLKKNVSASKKPKSDVTLIDLNSDDDCIILNKKQKLNSCSEINAKSNGIDSCGASVIKEKIDSSVNDNDLKVISPGSLKNIYNDNVLNGRNDDSSRSKKRKSKEAKLEEKDKKAALAEDEVLSFMKVSNVNDEILSKKEKSRRYFELEKNNDSMCKDEVTESNFDKTLNVQSRKVKKTKLKQLKMNDSDVIDISCQDSDNEINSSKKRKEILRYFNFEEIDNKTMSARRDQLDEKVNDSLIQEDKKLTAKKIKKSKLKQEEINDSAVDIPDKHPDNEINSNKRKKQRLRYFNFEEESNNQATAMEQDQLDEKVNDSFVQENKKLTPKKIKKSKFKQEEINDSGVDIPDEDLKYKRKKQRLRYFNFEEEINSEATTMEEDQLDEKINGSFTQKSKKLTKNSSHKTIDTINTKVKSGNLKNFKLKQEETDDISLDTSLTDNNMDSQDITKTDESFPTIGRVYKQKDEVVKHTLPHWLSNPTYISVNLQEKEIPISELNYLNDNTQNNLSKSGIKFLFPVQLAVIPWLMQSNKQSLFLCPSDICVSAPTGSGKTLAFVLPIVQSLKDRVVSAIRALVVLPVSELAIQVYKVFETYVQGTDLKVALVIGKKSFIAEQNSLVKSTSHSLVSFVDIVVATPGRILDHIYRTKGFCLKRLRYLVIDEADRMMEEIQQGWLKQVENAVFHNQCTSPICVCSSYKRTFYEPTSAYNFGFISQPLQKLLYSATLTHDPEQLHSLSLYKPKLFTASPVCPEKENKGLCVVPPELKMLQVICEEGAKPMIICHLIKHHNFKKVLCFTETVERAHRLHLVLEEMGIYQVREISSFNRPVQRKIVLEQFSSGKIDILVCSDLVARGIDIENVDCVISYDVPQLVKNYIHRIGRTARAGKTGTALALLSASEVPQFKKMLNSATIKLPEEIHISPEDLKPLVKSFQSALSVADAKLKKELFQRPGKSRRKSKKKLK